MLLQCVRQIARQHALFRAETRVVVALSGGSDSVALALLLHELDIRNELRLVGVAHFNHQLRAHAARDEACSAGVARSLDVPFTADREDVAARARRERRSVEDAARRARHEFFARARAHFSADVVALGHTRDDQAETFLLRLLRGAGPRGLAAMYPRHGAIVRPMLRCRRLDLRAYLDARQVAYVEDETNDDVAIPRNRVRAELVPLLSERFNPNIVEVLAHEAELAREVWAWLETEAERFASPGASELDVAVLLAAPAPLRRLVVWRTMNEVSAGRFVSFSHVDAALALLDTDRGAVDAPGHRVQRVGPRLVLTVRSDAVSGRRGVAMATANLFEYSLSIPGEVHLAEAGCAVAAEFGAEPEDGIARPRSGRGPLARVRRDLCRGPLIVRNRRPGDSFRPVGLGGRKKLQDYFVDRKVALARRDQVPLVVDQSDRIVWVAGYGIDEAFRVTDPSQGVLLLRLRWR